jgi:FlaG/FlaF family flagellin (archaellin)
MTGVCKRSRVAKLRKSVKAISPTIAVLLMIAIAVIAAIVVYLWIMGFLNFNTNKAGKAIQIQSVMYTGTHLVVYVQNVGQGAVTFTPNQCLYVDSFLRNNASVGIDLSIYLSANQGTLEQTKTASIVDNVTLSLNQKIKLKVVTNEGTWIEAYFTVYTFTGDYTLTLSVVGNGHVDLVPLGPYYGETVQLTAVADPHWTFGDPLWSGDRSGNTNPEQILMDGNKAVTVTFVPITHQITFSQTGVDSDFVGNVVTIDGTGYTVTDLQLLTFTWNEASAHSFSFASPLAVDAGKQYVWTSTSGLSSDQSGSITVEGPGSVTGYYETQYRLTMVTNFGTANPLAGEEHWYPAGTSVTIEAFAPSAGAGEQYVWIGWTGTGTGSYTGTDNPATNAVTMNGPITETASWTHQYYLTMSTNFGSVSPDSGWYNAGSTFAISATGPSVGDGERYVWNGWDGSGSGTFYDGSDNPVTITMDGPINEAASWTHQYLLTMATNFGTTSPSVGEEHWYPAGTSMTIEAFAPSAGAGEQYVWIGWTGTGTGSYTGTDNPATDAVMMDGPITETAQWKKQYYVTFSADPSDKGTTTPDGWYDAGNLAISATVIDPAYKFSVWIANTGSITFVDSASASTTAILDGPGTITANFALNTVDITVTSNPASDQNSPYFVKVDGVEVQTPYGPVSWTIGDTHTLEALSPVSGTTGTQYAFTGWSDGGSPTHTYTVPNAPATVTANYKIQYGVTFDQIGLDSTASGTVVTINGAAKVYGDLPNTIWLDSGDTVTYAHENLVSSSAADTRFSLVTVAGPVSPITVTTPVTVTANYKTQYHVTFEQTGLDSDALADVLNVNSHSVIYADFSYSIWMDSGSSVSYSYYATVQSSVQGKQFRLSSVTGPSSPISVSGPATVTGNYVIQYGVTFAQSGLDSTANGAAVVNVNGFYELYGSLPYSIWVDSGAPVTYNYEGTVSSSTSGKQFVLTGVTGPSSPITVSSAITVTGNYKTQYQVTFAVNPTSPVPGYMIPSGTNIWYDSGANQQIIAIVTNPSYHFSKWTATGSISFDDAASDIATATIGGTGTITANFAQNRFTLTTTVVSGSGSIQKNPDQTLYDPGTVVQLTAVPANGYRLTVWGGDLSGSTNPTSITMNSNKAVTATFVTGTATSIAWISWPDQVTIGQDFSSLGILMPGLNNEQIRLTFTRPDGTKIISTTNTFSFIFDGLFYAVATPDAVGQWSITAQFLGEGTYGAFTSTPRTFQVVSTPTYAVSFTQTGIPSGSAPIVTYHIGSAGFDQQGIVPFSALVPQGAQITYSYQQTVSGATGVQYVRTSTSPSSPQTISGPLSVTGTYKTQYQHTIASSPAGSGYVTVDGSGVTTPYTTPWWDSGSSHTIAANSAVAIVPSQSQYIYSSWSDSGARSHSVSPTAVTTYTASFQLQYYFSVSSARDSATGQGWYNAGSSVSSTVTRPVSGGTGIQYETTGWTGTGSLSSGGSIGASSTGSFAINAYSTCTWNWKTLYQLTMNTNFGTVSPASGGWYDVGSKVTILATAPSEGAGERFLWVGWTGSGSGSYTGTDNPATDAVTMNAAITETASWSHQYQLTVTASPSQAIGGTFSVTYTQGGTVHTNEAHTTTWTGWADGGTTATVSSPQSPFGSYTFGSYTNNPATMNSGQTISLTYSIQPITITLRPNAAGSTTQNEAQGSGSANWDRVDETTVGGDGATTYVRGDSDNAWQDDSYDIPDQALSGTITNVKIYIVCNKDNNDLSTLQARTIIRLGSGTIEYGATQELTTTWTPYSSTYATKSGNLGTGSWTWSDINSLQIGVSLKSQNDNGWGGSGWTYAQCTQVYVEITYMPG